MAFSTPSHHPFQPFYSRFIFSLKLIFFFVVGKSSEIDIHLKQIIHDVFSHDKCSRELSTGTGVKNGYMQSKKIFEGNISKML